MVNTYYLTIIHPNDSTFEPTRLLNMNDSSKAKKVLKQKQKLYPGCQVFIEKS